MKFPKGYVPGTGVPFTYRPQHTDLSKFSDGYASAFGKKDNVLADCLKCNTRHWTHQSCNTKPQCP